MEFGVQLPTTVRFLSAQTGSPQARRQLLSEDVSVVTTPIDLMNRRTHAFRAVSVGLLVTLVQLFVAIVLIAPEGPLSYRYSTLVQHDSYWFANIVDRGYGTIVPPIDQKMMEVSNVAFFPAYPAIAGLLHRAGFSTSYALLVTAQTAAWGFWSYFFLFCDRWNLSPLLQFFGALAIFAHPTAFFLVAGYSESLFLMGLFGFMYWSSAEGRVAKVLAGLHGITMSATRIVGLPCAAYPMVKAVCTKGWSGLRDTRQWVRQYALPAVLTAVATLGTIGFFIYCQLRWGSWNLYMATQEAGWAISPDYLAVLKPASYRWLIPPLNDPTQWSQMTMTVGALCFVAVAICELIPAIRHRTSWQSRIGFYFLAFVTYYIAVSGVASVQMESMLRYQFCAHTLIVLAFLHFLAQFRTPPILARAFGMAAVALLSAAGLSLQGWWVWNFTRGDWVA